MDWEVSGWGQAPISQYLLSLQDRLSPAQKLFGHPLQGTPKLTPDRKEAEKRAETTQQVLQ